MPIPPPDGNRSFFQVLRLTIKTGQEAQKDLSQLSMEAADNSDKTPTAYLVDLVSNRKIPIPTPSCKVGRDDLNDVVITGDQSISRFHFVISEDDGQYYAQDSKSRHGTFLNGNPINGTEPIKDGDVLKVGVSLFWFVLEAAGSPSGATPTPPVNVEALRKENTGASTPLSLSPKKTNSYTSATTTSDSMPAISPDSSLAAKLGVKSPSFDKMASPMPTQARQSLGGGVEPGKSSSSGANSEPASKATKALDSLESDAKSSVSDATDEKESAEKEESKEKAPDLVATVQDEDALPEKPEESEAEAPEPELKKEEEVAAAQPSFEEAETAKTETQAEEEKAKTGTLELFAEVLGEAASQGTPSHTQASEPQKVETPTPDGAKGAKPEAAEPAPTPVAVPTPVSAPTSVNPPSGNGSKTATSPVKKTVVANAPDWCGKYLVSEITGLNREVDELNENVRLAQLAVQEVEERIAHTKNLRNILLSGEGDTLVETCQQILTKLNWQAKISDSDKQELKLENGERVSIARVVWSANGPERSQLGHLNISQTRFWCEKGAEPKGFLIVSRSGNEPPSPLGDADFKGELADYANKKSVCLMTTVQLLAIYRDIVFNKANPDKLRDEIMSCNGWLKGYQLDAATTSGDKEEQRSSNRFSSLLSA
jgi:pSer/pThr/pTyr-binding forkhead associated (FHA) protein